MKTAAALILVCLLSAPAVAQCPTCYRPAPQMAGPPAYYQPAGIWTPQLTPTLRLFPWVRRYRISYGFQPQQQCQPQQAQQAVPGTAYWSR